VRFAAREAGAKERGEAARDDRAKGVRDTRVLVGAETSKKTRAKVKIRLSGTKEQR
jgi:hypothetical protein